VKVVWVTLTSANTNSCWWEEVPGRRPTLFDTSRRRWGQPHLLPGQSPVWGATPYRSGTAPGIHRRAAPPHRQQPPLPGTTHSPSGRPCSPTPASTLSCDSTRQDRLILMPREGGRSAVRRRCPHVMTGVGSSPESLAPPSAPTRAAGHVTCAPATQETRFYPSMVVRETCDDEADHATEPFALIADWDSAAPYRRQHGWVPKPTRRVWCPRGILTLPIRAVCVISS